MSMASFHARKPKGRLTKPGAAPQQPVRAKALSGQERADVLLVLRGLAPSRAVAQRLIKARRMAYGEGDVEATINKASQMLPTDAVLRLRPCE